jgi:hypothetical protein
MKKILALLLVCGLAGCGIVGRSDAYSLGFKQGKEFKELGDFSKIIESYDLGEGSFDDTPELTSEGIRGACEAFWLLNGIIAELVNSPENKNDYLDGCEVGSR